MMRTQRAFLQEVMSAVRGWAGAALGWQTGLARSVLVRKIALTQSGLACHSTSPLDSSRVSCSTFKFTKHNFLPQDRCYRALEQLTLWLSSSGRSPFTMTCVDAKTLCSIVKSQCVDFTCSRSSNLTRSTMNRTEPREIFVLYSACRTRPCRNLLLLSLSLPIPFSPQF